MKLVVSFERLERWFDDIFIERGEFSPLKVTVCRDEKKVDNYAKRGHYVPASALNSRRRNILIPQHLL